MRFVRQILMISAALLLIGVAQRFAHLAWAGALCRDPVIAHEPGSAGHLPLGPCVEYWFNRYQTMLGAIVALIAAYTAWFSFKTQIALQTDAKRKEDAAATISLITDFEALDRGVERIKPALVRALLCQNVTQVFILRNALQGLIARIRETRRAYERSIVVVGAFRANNAILVTSAPLFTSLVEYIDVLEIFVDGILIMMTEIKLPILPDEVRDSTLAHINSYTESQNGWSQYRELRKVFLATCLSALDRAEVNLTDAEWFALVRRLTR